MQDNIIYQLESYIMSSINEHYTDKSNIFDKFISRCQLYYDRPAHSIGEIKLKMNKKLKGDIFEHFCYKYLLHCYPNISNVWFLKDLPDDLCLKLSLKKNDLGIDLVAKDTHNKFYAIQAKYRKRNQYKPITVVGWKELSTFYGIVNKTGPFYKHIVITNANYIRHIGNKTIKDKSICYLSLKNIKLDQWLAMTNIVGHSLLTTSTIETPDNNIIEISDNDTVNNETIIDKVDELNDTSESSNSIKVKLPTPKITFKKKIPLPLTNEEIRLKRLAYYDKLLNTSQSN